MKDFDLKSQLIAKANKVGNTYINGREVVDCTNADIRKFNKKCASVALTENGECKWGYVDVYGNVVIDFNFDAAGPFSEGLAAVKQNGKWGFINTEGELFVDCKYEEALSFTDGFAKVRLDGKWGFINSFGKLIIKCKYDSIDYFYGGVSCVVEGDKTFFIDGYGNKVGWIDYYKEGMTELTEIPYNYLSNSTFRGTLENAVYERYFIVENDKNLLVRLAGKFALKREMRKLEKMAKKADKEEERINKENNKLQDLEEELKKGLI